MKRLVPFAVPFVAIVAAGIGAWLVLAAGPRPCTDHDEVGLVGLDPVEQPCIAVDGTAHYTAVARQTVTSGLFRDEQVFYLFPLMPPDDYDGREVRVLVRTTRAPERLVSYETLAMTGRIERATPELVPYRTEIELGKAGGYFFTDDLVVLTPDEIISDGVVWRPLP
jgi:hypothetical protein